MKYSFNTFFNVFTQISSFEILYNIKSKNLLLNIIQKNKNLNEIQFLKDKRQFKKNVINVIKLTQVKMIIQFDKKHRSSKLKKQVYVKLAKIEQMKYHVSLFNFLIIKKLDFYSIKKKISSLTYEIALSSTMHIHSIISMIHLKQVRTDSFEREISKITFHELIIIDDHEKYVMKKILKTKKKWQVKLHNQMKRLYWEDLKVRKSIKARCFEVDRKVSSITKRSRSRTIKVNSLNRVSS